MSGFGGAVKLTGESEYRQALKNITQSLREVSSQLQLNAAKYDANDKSVENLAKKEQDLNKIYKVQETEVKNLRTAYESFNKKVQEQAKAHEELEKTYKQEKSELDRIEKTLGTTSKEYQDQKKKVEDLEKALIKSRQENDNNRNALSKMGVALNKAETDLIGTAKEMDNLGKEAEQTSKQVKNSGDGFTVFKGVLSNLYTKGITLAIDGLKKLGSVAISVGKQALQSYADYEQLIGGVETLFKDSAKTVEGYANQAYKTAGLSANKYMETVTSFSASLLQGLNNDTAKTAEVANMAIIDMADNANKMGTSMEMIQNAYQGFAKQNYTMLDNLKLGYGGTKTEMVRLINDSKILNHEIKNLDDITFDQIVQAIHVVQENMGITGTTAKEAEHTITGSVASMKSAWQNLLTGIADGNQDLGKLVNNFVDSVITAGKNVVPRVKEIVEGVKKLITNLVKEVFPKLKKEIPELKPLIEGFEWFIKNRNMIVGALKAIAVAFAVAKVAQFTKSISDGGKALLVMVKDLALATTATTANTTATVANTTATTAGTTATTALSVAQGLLNKVMSANPVGVVVAGLVALYAIMNKVTESSRKLAEAEKENYEEIQAETQKIKDNQQAWNELTQARQDTINVGMTELSNYKALYTELDSIVDANGRVKEGYEARASFITTTLKDALGVEIELVGDQVKGMQNLRDSIDEVIEKKKAQIILNSQEELYTEAVNKQMEAVRQLTEYQNRLAEEKKKEEEINNAVIEAQNKYNEAQKWGGAIAAYYYSTELKNAQKRKEAWEQGVVDLENSITQSESLVAEYTYNIGQYEANMALAHAEKYDEMTNITWNYVKDYSNATDAEKAMLEDNVANTTKLLDILKQNRSDANANIIDGEIAKNERLLAEQQKALDEYNAKTTSALNKAQLIWSEGLDDQLSEVMGYKVEFKDAGNGQVQAYVNGIQLGEPKAKDEMAKLATDAIYEISKQKTGATTAGEDLIDGINNGIGNQRKQSGVFGTIRNFGFNLLANLKKSLEEQSPSKATKKMGQYLLEGLGLGIEKEENGLLSQVKSLGNSIVSVFDSSLNASGITAGISDQIRSGMPINTSLNNTTSAIQMAESQDYSYKNMVLAFQEALASMKIELDDEEAGRFVRRTVENAIYT